MLSFHRFLRRNRPTSGFAPTGMLLGAVLIGACCGHRGENTTSLSYSYIDSDGKGEVTINGVRIEFDGSVHYLYHRTSTSPGGSQTTTTVNGNDFGLRGDTFFIGDREYGTAGSGAHVVVSSDGVTIDGEVRGPLPESREE